MKSWPDNIFQYSAKEMFYSSIDKYSIGTFLSSSPDKRILELEHAQCILQGNSTAVQDLHSLINIPTLT